ncbi:hypothetical protein [Candidatus Halobonum tyrrellensis]|uniref:CHAT domain-containing protein n=1 Tax=Candidatus Halobonum tyrrellensis G22 TaxID=1324957 RepID=V4HFK2_9EURY|nr:hypothetical protein [Candidatus Halobonum tyrrellensis]ESP88853.1 hypothetical protein K933_07147 [Candidatus Halobonum tyrrellensis G22]
MRVETTDEGLRAADATKSSITVSTGDWADGADAPSIAAAHERLGDRAPHTPETAVSGETARLGFPPYRATVRSLSSGDTTTLARAGGHLDLPADEYLLVVQGSVVAQVRFDGPATLSLPNYERVVLSLPARAPVEVGFVSRVADGVGTVTVPRTPQGLATAVSVFGAVNRTETPDRTYPSMRGPAPRVEFGATDVPSEVRERVARSGVELAVPPDPKHLFVAAPLAAYLDAEVTLVDPERAALVADGERWPLPGFPAFPDRVAGLLRRVFFLDCLVRVAGPHDEGVDQVPLLSEVGLDAETVYPMSVAERVGAYLDVPFESISDRLPDWHLSMYVKPTFDHVAALPHLVPDLPFVLPPDATDLESDEWLDRSLSDFYRASHGDVASIDLVRPTLGPGRTHGWLADGVPIDVFKATTAAYENRARYLDAAGEPLSVTAVLNDSRMRDEQDDAAARYREHAEELDVDIEVRESLTVDDLAAVFESRHDLVHYIGHCETGGLRCSDGTLSVSSIDESNVQTFFLNACGSYYEGRELVRKGSVAGGVTLNEVLDSHAATVGTTFAQLMAGGYCIERSLDKARRRIMTGKDYAVVGDGTHVLTQSTSLVPADVELDRVGPDEFRVRYCVDGPRLPGASHHCYLRDDDGESLLRTREEYVVDRAKIREFLGYCREPILYEGDLHWPEELRESVL